MVKGTPYSIRATTSPSRFADLICDTFGAEEGKIHGYPGHQEIELALVKLYRVTGTRKYLELAKYFIDARGEGREATERAKAAKKEKKEKKRVFIPAEPVEDLEQ